MRVKNAQLIGPSLSSLNEGKSKNQCQKKAKISQNIIAETDQSGHCITKSQMFKCSQMARKI